MHILYRSLIIAMVLSAGMVALGDVAAPLGFRHTGGASRAAQSGILSSREAPLVLAVLTLNDSFGI